MVAGQSDARSQKNWLAETSKWPDFALLKLKDVNFFISQGPFEADCVTEMGLALLDD